MATVRKTITVTEQQDAWIAAQIVAGHYTDDSEAIRDLIRHEQERHSAIEDIRQALIEGGAKRRTGAIRLRGVQTAQNSAVWLNIRSARGPTISRHPGLDPGSRFFG